MFTLWPGYRGMVRYGRWSFLGIAILFAVLLNTFLIVNFYWTALVTPMQRNLLLLGLFTAWAFLYAIAAFRGRMIEATLKTDAGDETFRRLVGLYLCGQWFEAESLLLTILKQNPRDVEILLLQATLYRHTRRYAEATAVLDRLALLETSGHWFLEIEAERLLIDEHLAELAAEPANPPNI